MELGGLRPSAGDLGGRAIVGLPPPIIGRVGLKSLGGRV